VRPVRAGAVIAAFALVAAVWAGGGASRTITAEFSRAVQVFPGVKVKVLGVDIGQVTDVQTDAEAVTVTLRINDPSIDLPARVNATIVPMSLLGERYIQLFPAYDGDAVLADGATIPVERTRVPAEGDELLQALQDYFGELDGNTVEDFVTNAATVLEGKGEQVNRLIDKATGVLSTLESRKDELANLIVQFNTLTEALATRGDALARLINTYNVVGATVDDARTSLEGTITGLNDASAALAGLLSDHRTSLGADVKTLTRTTRTIDRNVDRLARTGYWGTRLFDTARRAIDFERDWLRLGNQAAPLADLILHRMEDRLVGVCIRLGQESCAQATYWEKRFPEIFCLTRQDCAPGSQKKRKSAPERTADDALAALPEEVQQVITKAAEKNCKEAKHPKKCRKKKKAAKEVESDGGTDGLGDVISDIIEGLPDLPSLPGGLP
jgi:virulence factor Mce-like protein